MPKTSKSFIFYCKWLSANLLFVFMYLITSHAYAESDLALGMMTGSKAGTYYSFGQDIKHAVAKEGVKILVKESGGSIDNINRINSTENAAFGIVQSDVLGFLTRSSEPESKKIAKKLRMIVPFYKEEVHIIAIKSISSFTDLDGKTVIVGPKGSGSWLTAANLFAMAGIRPAKLLRLSPEDGLLEVLRERADAMIFVAGKPVKLFKNMEALSEKKSYLKLLNNVHFLPLSDDKMLKEYSSSVITKDDYTFVEQDIPTIAVNAILVSFDFSQTKSKYAVSRCNAIKHFGEALAKHIRELQRDGHPKWKEVNLSAEVGIWKRDKCAILSPSTTKLEDEFLKGLLGK